uniref:hypothetical protein n=1 Tax=Nonomuraea sp. CA-251285 TaxID=3240002 RepID=UPI003F49A696
MPELANPFDTWHLPRASTGIRLRSRGPFTTRLRRAKTGVTAPASREHLPTAPERRTYQLGTRQLARLDVIVPVGDGPHLPYLRWADVIVVNHSGGKDSSVALHEAVRVADLCGVRDRLVVLHNDLGRVEWPSTAELDAQHGRHYRDKFGATLVELFGDRPSARGVAERQAARYGLPFVVRSRTGGDLLQQIEQYGKFPDAGNRHCTSEQKRAPKFRLFTELVKLADLGRKVRILDINGERADESKARAAKPAVEWNRMASNATKRDVLTWRIVHEWSLADVWACHWANNLEWHWAYEVMSRLSCSICVLAAVADVTWGCAMRPDLADDVAALEVRIDHLFKNKRSITWYIAEGAKIGPAALAARRAETRKLRHDREAVAACPEPESLFELAGAF